MESTNLCIMDIACCFCICCTTRHIISRKKYNLANSSQRFTYINMKQTFNSGLYFVLHGIMMLHKQLNFEVLSREVFNIPEICTSGVSFTCVSDYTISKL